MKNTLPAPRKSLVAGTLIGAFQGYLIGYLTISAFIVTLGGLLVWRNTAWYMSNGQTIGPLDAFWSWVLAALAVVGVLVALWSAWPNKMAHGFDVKPLWAELVMAAILSGAILGFVTTLNAYQIPTRRLARLFEARGEVMPEGYSAAYGLPISVIVLILVAIAMTLCDRASVMKNGKLVGSVNVAEVTDDNLLGMIILGKHPASSPA